MPQWVPDGHRVVITLRDGLRFHDGEPVRAQDVVDRVPGFAIFGGLRQA
ncbi:MAG: hypothetical protein NVSMB18_08280 [Acetobacteraceae bacterium]